MITPLLLRRQTKLWEKNGWVGESRRQALNLDDAEKVLEEMVMESLLPLRVNSAGTSLLGNNKDL